MTPRLLSILILGMLSPAAHAANDFVVKPFLALVTMEEYKDGIAAGLGLGWPLENFTRFLSAEVEYMKSFARMESTSGKRSFSKTAAFAALTYPFDPRVRFKGKIGFRYATYKDTGAGSGSGDDVGADFGVGVQLLLDSLRTVEVEYITSDENDFSQALVGLRIQF
jgi:hypothetical protein